MRKKKKVRVQSVGFDSMDQDLVQLDLDDDQNNQPTPFGEMGEQYARSMANLQGETNIKFGNFFNQVSAKVSFP